MKTLNIILILLISLSFSACEKKQSPGDYPPIGGGPSDPEAEIKIIRDLLRNDPKNLPALIKLGNILYDSGRYREASDAYEKALQIDPNNVDVRVDRGNCLRYMGLPQKAQEEYRKAISINPRHAFAHKNLAVVLAYDLGDGKGAAAEFEKYLTLNPRDPDAPAIRQEIIRLRQK